MCVLLDCGQLHTFHGCLPPQHCTGGQDQLGGDTDHSTSHTGAGGLIGRVHCLHMVERRELFVSYLCDHVVLFISCRVGSSTLLSF